MLFHLPISNPSKMGIISFPTSVFYHRPPLRTKSSFSCNPWSNLNPIPKKTSQRVQVLGGSLSPLSDQALRWRWFSINRKRLTPVVSAVTPEGTDPKVEDRRAVETVQKLYTAIKNKNIKEVSDLIGDECRCFCDFISASQPFIGKKQVLEFYDLLMRILGENASLKFDLTMHDGMTVGVSWKLELKGNRVPLGSGFVFHVCQEYGGKVVIKNVNMLMDPLIHLGPLRLKMVGAMMLIMDKFGSFTLLESKRRNDIYMFLISSWAFAILFFLIRFRA